LFTLEPFLVVKPIRKNLPSLGMLMLITSAIALVAGCAGLGRRVELPSEKQFEREQLRVFSDVELPKNHRLLEELTARRRDIANILLLPMSDEPIQVYLFDDEKRYQRYLKQNHPQFPNRRAFFLKNDTELKVFAYWGEFVAEDLRQGKMMKWATNWRTFCLFWYASPTKRASI
jgi:hypothetical protein